MEAIFRPLWMKDAVIVVSTLAVLALIVWAYMRLRPSVVLPHGGIVAQCPARWSRDGETGECVPQYPTQCKSFNPDTYTDAQKCDIAQSCGTYWKGLCGLP